MKIESLTIWEKVQNYLKTSGDDRAKFDQN